MAHVHVYRLLTCLLLDNVTLPQIFIQSFEIQEYSVRYFSCRDYKMSRYGAIGPVMPLIALLFVV